MWTSKQRTSSGLRQSRRVTVPHQTGPMPTCGRGYWPQRKQCRLPTCTKSCFLDGHAQVPDRSHSERAVADGHGFAACHVNVRGTARHVRPAQGQRGLNVRPPTREAPVSPFVVQTRRCQGLAAPCCPVRTEQTDLPGWRIRRQGKDIFLSCTIWLKPQPDAELALRCGTMDVVSWFQGVLQQFWIGVALSVRRNQGTQRSREDEVIRHSCETSCL